jgi:hypothetical protein
VVRRLGQPVIVGEHLEWWPPEPWRGPLVWIGARSPPGGDRCGPERTSETDAAA